MNQVLNTLAMNVRSRRRDRHLSQTALATAAGVSRGVIARLEIGTGGNIGVETVALLAKGLACTVAELIAEPTPPEATPARAVRGVTHHRKASSAKTPRKGTSHS